MHPPNPESEYSLTLKIAMSKYPKRDWKSVNRKRNKQLNLRLSPEEYKQIKDDADLMQITAGAYVRKVVLDAPVPRQSKRPSIEVQKLAHLLGQIHKIGCNINQIAKAANSNISYDQNDLSIELEMLKDVCQDIKKALKGKRK